VKEGEGCEPESWEKARNEKNWGVGQRKNTGRKGTGKILKGQIPPINLKKKRHGDP